MKNSIRNLFSRPMFQPLLLKLLKFSHAGLNYGGGQSVETSGEIAALQFALDTVSTSGAPFTLFDVGANNGSYLDCALRILGARSRVYSFEPQSASFEVLRTRFGEDPRLRLYRTALGSNSGSASLFFDVKGETTATLNRNANAAQCGSEIVSLTTVDEVCSAERIERIHFLKIDTEGSEMDVLLGAANMMAQNRIDAIQFEFGDTFVRTPYHFIDFWERLAPRFRMYRILRRGLCPVANYSSELEIFKIANFLCLLR